EELYILAAYARDQGQDFIPVHIFPVNFNNPKSVDYLKRHLQTFTHYTAFANKMRNAFYYFEKHRQVPLVLVNQKGEYILDEESVPPLPARKEVKVYVKKKRVPVAFDEKTIPTTVNHLPEFPGGAEALRTWLSNLSKSLVPYLAEGQKTAYVMM